MRRWHPCARGQKHPGTPQGPLAAQFAASFGNQAGKLLRHCCVLQRHQGRQSPSLLQTEHQLVGQEGVPHPRQRAHCLDSTLKQTANSQQSSREQ